jgi:phosphate transport system permease protein
MIGLSGIAALLGMSLLALILGYTIIQGLNFINVDFLTSVSRPVGEVGGGMRNEILGTMILVVLASALAIPVGLMTGLFLADFGSPNAAAAFRFVADILAGVPSIVVGVFAFAIVVKPMHSYSALAGGVALAIIMVPIVARTAEEALRMVPVSQREAALALGITRWRSVLGVVIPGALTGIVTGIMLGVARIAGETAPLLFTALGSNFGLQGLLEPIGALPLQIFKYATSPFPEQQHQAWAGAFLLIILVLIISVIVRWLSRGKKY